MSVKQEAIKADTTAYDDTHGSWMFRNGFESGAYRYIRKALSLYAIAVLEKWSVTQFEEELKK